MTGLTFLSARGGFSNERLEIRVWVRNGDPEFEWRVTRRVEAIYRKSAFVGRGFCRGNHGKGGDWWSFVSCGRKIEDACLCGLRM